MKYFLISLSVLFAKNLAYKNTSPISPREIVAVIDKSKMKAEMIVIRKAPITKYSVQLSTPL